MRRKKKKSNKALDLTTIILTALLDFFVGLLFRNCKSSVCDYPKKQVVVVRLSYRAYGEKEKELAQMPKHTKAAELCLSAADAIEIKIKGDPPEIC